MSIFLLISLFLVVASAEGGYNGNSKVPKFEKPNFNPSIFGVQGIIYCKSGPKLIPLEGAKARITCLALDRNGYESAPFSVLSCPADNKGYFFATFSSAELEDTWKLTECKAFLENSPLEECNVPTDFNKGMGGSLLSSFKLLKSMKLYTVGPFVYTTNSDPKPAPTGY